MGIHLPGIGAPGAVRGVKFGTDATMTVGAAKVASWKEVLTAGVDLTVEGALAGVTTATAGVFAAAEKAVAGLPQELRLELAQVTHDSYYNGADKEPVESATTIFGDPLKILPSNVEALKALLTDDGKGVADQFVSGTHIGKAFLLPNHILPGKAEAFLAFFGKSDASAIAALTKLVDEGNAKKKIVNNQAAPWGSLMARIDAIYGDKAAEMKDFETGLQYTSVADSVITLALLNEGLIGEGAAEYDVFHVLWSTHNDWQPLASVNYKGMERAEQKKDDIIYEAHRAVQDKFSSVFEAVLAA